MTLARFTTLHPYRSSFGFLLMVVVVVIAVSMINTLFLMGNLVQLAVGDLILAGIGIFLLTRLDWWGKGGYTTGIRLAHLPLLILPCAIALFSLGKGIQVTTPIAILVFAALTLIVGFAEETFFRGLILTSLLPTGMTRAVVLSSVLFAAPHFLNIIGGLWDPYFTVADSIAAFGLGITFAAIRIRTGSIWPLVGIHALFDFTSLVSLGGIKVAAQSPQALFTSVFIGIAFVAYGLFLLRNEIKKQTGFHEQPVIIG
jgi:membrane protease YdiL (CAAX protease family)